MRVVDNRTLENPVAKLRVRVLRSGEVSLSLEGELRGDLIRVALEALGGAVRPRMEGDDSAQVALYR